MNNNSVNASVETLSKTNMQIITAVCLFFLNEIDAFSVAPRYKSLTTSQPSPQRRSTKLNAFQTQGTQGGRSTNAVESFFQAWNNRDLNTLVDQFAEDCTFEDATYPGPFDGKDAINRHFRLLADATTTQFVLNEIAVGADDKIAVQYRLEEDNEILPYSRHCAFYTLDQETGLITSVFDTVEPESKSGATDLAVLSIVGKLLGGNQETTNELDPVEENRKTSPSKAGFFDQLFNTNRKPTNNAAERYFEAWNRRDMDAAIDVFADDCQYEDTVFPEPFDGKAALKKHLYLCADSMPSTFPLWSTILPIAETD
jgi:ketosteroid isomerase-like protein